MADDKTTHQSSAPVSASEEVESGSDRRTFLKAASTVAMVSGLAGGYGALGAVAGRFLYPAQPTQKQWMFVAQAQEFTVGDSRVYRGPIGETINITRQAETGELSDFIALSSTCPHLGCQVHWETQNNRFFCPCHNGTFDASGKGTGGPPGDAGQSLPRYALKVEKNLLFIEVATSSTVAGNTLQLQELVAPSRVDPKKARRS